MATDLTSAETVPEPQAEAPLVAPAPAPPNAAGRPHRLRFGAIYGGLAVVLGLAIAGVALYATDSLNPGPKWSAWKPSGGGLGAAPDAR